MSKLRVDDLPDQDLAVLCDKVWVVKAKRDRDTEIFVSDPMDFVAASNLATRIMKNGYWIGDPKKTCQGTIPDMYAAVIKGKAKLILPCIVEIKVKSRVD